ncbi:MAG TPA: ATP-binding cassette domain-containing protein [Spirochaetota bacterium]|jgi:Fe-S cluster assembly ATP-binding protein|nr:ATP-binding cassette domain-containing protein [Spirochaetota bacterium]OPZ35659.1 MAG: Sulfate/thiosulfate import ATP-binding protein CysA [Spirochaetes bacterium ADurb.BinA120]HNU93174.1 ATP-binding cassette domain-containing protein [Spirochaetota bacterium]HPI15223.1 ATP-binding cassette domain-containing protein [Spirochaetota bacterium]
MLELKDLVFSVDEKDGENGGQKIEIIKGIDYSFEKGKFYAVTGPNGSGKTTLARLIMGINKETSGSIIFEGEDITGLSITERAKLGISYSFQHPARFKGITFRDLLAIAGETDDEEKLLSIVRRMGICPLSFLDKPVDSTLSGGEIKKIELATTIARNPKLAIYDEPDTGIDLWTIMPMVNLLKNEQEENGTTTIVVSHNKSFFEVADTILILNGGAIIYEGDMEGALPMLADFRICNFIPCERGEMDARCFR